jgi:hypothetical protein
MKWISLSTIVILATAFLIGSNTSLLAHGPGGFHLQRICDQLTDEQREELHDTVDAMIEEGATRCEIHETIRSMAEGYGVELPEHPFGHHGLRGVFDQLTDEQHAEIHETVDAMREEGASPCEIHETVRDMVEGYGIELPDGPGRHPHRGWRHR